MSGLSSLAVECGFNVQEMPMVESIVGGPAYRAGLMKELEEAGKEVRRSAARKAWCRVRLVIAMGRVR